MVRCDGGGGGVVWCGVVWCGLVRCGVVVVWRGVMVVWWWFHAGSVVM